jgi:glycosyltransferase involved in cell wall biosynthesis
MSHLLGVCGIYRKHQFAGGWYSFLENLLRGFAQMRRSASEPNVFELVVFQGSEPLRWQDSQLQYRQVPDRWGRIPAEARVGLLESRGLDGVLFPNTFTPPVVRAKRAVTVVHDLHYLNLPEHWPFAKRAWLRCCHEFTLRRCDAVVAISDWVKHDILKHFGERWESRVSTIWNPISLERFGDSAEQTFTGGRPYILCAAADRPSKNLSSLIRAFALVRDKFPEHCLVLAGQLRSEYGSHHRQRADVNSKLPSAIDLVEKLNLARHVVVTGFVSDEQLGALYRNAALFVLPSLFEGFGMPAVESLALGAPTLVSDLAVLREVTFNNAYYIADPLNDRQMADEIAQVLTLGDAARPLPEFRREIGERFAPENIARQYLKLLTAPS